MSRNVAALGVRYGLPLPHLFNDSVTLAAAGTVVHSTAKILRFGHAGGWQRRYDGMQSLAGDRAGFESGLRQVAELDGSSGDVGLSGAVARFRSADAALTTTRTKARTAGIQAALDTLRADAGAPAADLLDRLDGLVGAKAKFDIAMDRHDTFAGHVSRSGAGPAVRRFLAGMHDEVDDQGARTGPVTDFVGQVGDVRAALAGWEPSATGPRASDDALAADLRAAVDRLHVAPRLRQGHSPVRWVLDGVQFTTYAVALGYSLHDGVTGEMLGRYATYAFDTAFAADAVRIAGVRFAGLLDGKLSKGATSTASSKLYTQWLPAVDDTATTAAGIATLGNGVQDLLGLHLGGKGPVLKPAFTWIHDLRVGVASGYSTVNSMNWWATMRRHFSDPALDDNRGRRWNLGLKVAAGVAAGVLVLDSSYQKLVGTGSSGSANNNNNGNNNGHGKGQPTPGVSPSTTPGLPTPGSPATPSPTATPTPSGSPSTAPSTGAGTPPPGTGSQPGGTAPGQDKPPGSSRPSPAQVVVAAGDPRRDTLWGIAQSNEASLLTAGEIAAVRAAGGGEDAETLAALKQLFQLNPQRGFRLALMDGVASAQPGDPDTLQPGWVIDVGNPAVS